jgi:hypothetical protein
MEQQPLLFPLQRFYFLESSRNQKLYIFIIHDQRVYNYVLLIIFHLDYIDLRANDLFYFLIF